MNRIVNVSCINTPNIGDMAASPCKYFKMPFPVQTEHVMGADNWDGNGHLIIGGGGLVHNTMIEGLGKFVAKTKGVKVCWGIGHNQHNMVFDSYPDWMNECQLIGLRDWISGTNWIPCASCMHPVFDEEIPVTRDIMVYNHYDSPLDIKGNQVLSNHQSSGESIERVVREIKASALILTNTYHGMYWSILANRRCIVVGAFSTRFLLSRWAAPMANKEDWLLSANKTMTYPDALDESRAANLKFYHRVMNCLL